MDLISTIMRWPNCEIFSYLDARGMNRWISDKSKASSFERAFGDNRWQQVLQQPEKDRRDQLLSLYKAALQDNGGVEYIQYFAMFDDNRDLLYWLFFCTNHLRGLEEMKRAMWFIDETGTFRFSDHDDPNQIRLLADAYSQEWLSTHLNRVFEGKWLTVSQIEEYILTKTPCYRYKEALISLERSEEVEVERAKGAPGGFSNPETRVHFLGGPHVIANAKITGGRRTSIDRAQER